MMAISLRMFLYAFFPHPTIILFIQLLHGFTFPFLWVAGVSYTHENAPQGMAATAQGLFGSVMTGFGSGAGGLLGGLLIERLNAAAMYGIMGGVVLAGLVLFFIIEKARSPNDPGKLTS
jgi:predicted MFS family arabinose efflux permease